MPNNEPSRFWSHLAQQHREELDRHGLSLFKRRQALRYFTWRWRPSAAFSSVQMRFLLRNSKLRDLLLAAARPAKRSEWNGVDWSLMERTLYTFATRLLWRYAKTRDQFDLLSVGEPSLGGPLPVRLKGTLISQDLANTALEVSSIAPFLSEPPKHVVEVGAGYGRTAHALLSIYPHMRYTVIDIEPALSISKWYLTSIFGEGRVTFLPAERADETQQADLGISISSLQEMTPTQVSRYVQLFDRTSALIYLKQLTSWKNPVDNTFFSVTDYPIPPHWQPLFSRTAQVQTNFTEAAWSNPLR